MDNADSLARVDLLALGCLIGAAIIAIGLMARALLRDIASDCA